LSVSSGVHTTLQPRRLALTNIKIDVREIVLVSVDWIYLAQDRDRRRAFFEHHNETSDFTKRREISRLVERTISFSRKTLLHRVN
jgi:hypothetical protein